MTLRYLFEKPSAWFLVLFGVIIELLAASTRALRFPFDREIVHLVASASSFGMVYLMACSLITYYNKFNTVSRYLLIFSSFGFIMEVTVGIDADLNRGNTYYTIYFVSAMLIGIFLGKILGSMASKGQSITEINQNGNIAAS